MSELQAFLAMLDRAGIRHGTRSDSDPPDSLAVQVDHDENETCTEWLFGAGGNLVSVIVCE